MILVNRDRGRFQGNPFSIGTTDKSKYYPVYAASDYLLDGRLLRGDAERLSESLLGNILLYKKPVNKAKKGYGDFTKYIDLFECLKYSISSEVFEFVISDESKFLTCSKGYIADIDDQ